MFYRRRKCVSVYLCVFYHFCSIEDIISMFNLDFLNVRPCDYATLNAAQTYFSKWPCVHLLLMRFSSRSLSD